MRVGDAERDACLEALVEHHVRGRLSVEEFEHRQRSALDAVTHADLAGLVADLPAEARLREPVPAGGSSLQAAGLWAGPPAVIVAASTVMAASLSSHQMFGGFLVASAMGYAAHWLVSRQRPA